MLAKLKMVVVFFKAVLMAVLTIGIFIYAIFSSLVSSYVDQHKPPPKKYHLQFDQKPGHFFTVSGTVKPGLLLKTKDKAKFVATYVADNSACNIVISRFEGATEPRGYDKTYYLQPNKDGSYQLKIPMDDNSPGYCRWYFAGVSFKYGKVNMPLAILSDKEKPTVGIVPIAKLRCEQDDNQLNCKSVHTTEKQKHHFSKTARENQSNPYQFKLDIL